MKARRARELAKALIPDIDGMIAGTSRPIEDRHSAAASALIIGARLMGGACINLARIADALDDIAYHMTEKTNGGPHDAPVRRAEADGELPHGNG